MNRLTASTCISKRKQALQREDVEVDYRKPSSMVKW